MGERKYRADAIQIAAEACAGREFGRTVAVACAVPVIEGFVDEDEFGLDRGEDAGEAFILAVGGDEGVGGLVGDHNSVVVGGELFLGCWGGCGGEGREDEIDVGLEVDIDALALVE